ncbi:MAG: imidazole glycerol phosphate synthase subunit HisF [Clostridiales bacterium GWB2_37_7]|nr:MAG: imidazole glycerol phosphate synthase subunit HisF [Clostridiales bacterium GWB2_37_7]
MDISASIEGRKTMLDIVKGVAKNVHIPLTVGGGIGTLEDMRNMLRAGADKIAVNTAGIKNPSLISEGAKKFGRQCIVGAVDAKWNAERNSWDVYSYGGRKNTSLDAVAWCRKLEILGAGEILLTSIDRDGTGKGFDIALLKSVSDSVSIPVIASGGAGRLEDFCAAFEEGRADAALAASLFHFGLIEISDLKLYLKNKGIPVRIERERSYEY